MASGAIDTINLRLKVDREGQISFGPDLVLATGIDISLFDVVGFNKSVSTGDELAEYIVTIVKK